MALDSRIALFQPFLLAKSPSSLSSIPLSSKPFHNNPLKDNCGSPLWDQTQTAHPLKSRFYNLKSPLYLHSPLVLSYHCSQPRLMCSQSLWQQAHSHPQSCWVPFSQHTLFPPSYLNRAHFLTPNIRYFSISPLKWSTWKVQPLYIFLTISCTLCSASSIFLYEPT